MRNLRVSDTLEGCTPRSRTSTFRKYNGSYIHFQKLQSFGKEKSICTTFRKHLYHFQDFWERVLFFLTNDGRRNSLPSKPPQQRCVSTECFSKKKVILPLCAHCAKFSESGTVGFGQERGKLGTGSWRHTNFSWQGKPIWSQVSWNRVVHWVARGTGTPKDRDEVNRREGWEWDGWVCELEAIGAPSIFKVIHKAAALARMLPTLDLRVVWFIAIQKFSWSKLLGYAT